MKPEFQMATRWDELPDLDRENVFQRVRREIEELFHSLIEKVNERREVLLTQLNQWEEEFTKHELAVSNL